MSGVAMQRSTVNVHKRYSLFLDRTTVLEPSPPTFTRTLDPEDLSAVRVVGSRASRDFGGEMGALFDDYECQGFFDEAYASDDHARAQLLAPQRPEFTR